MGWFHKVGAGAHRRLLLDLLLSMAAGSLLKVLD